MTKIHIIRPQRKIKQKTRTTAYHLGDGSGHADGVAARLRRDARLLEQQHARRQHRVVELPEDPGAAVGVGVVTHPDLEGEE